jgi:N-acetylmuramoyl-L-alanine amidase
VHTKNGRWLPWVDKYDTADWNNGIAGIKGVPIDGIQMDLTGIDGYEVKYRVSLTGTTSYLPYVVGTEDYAGIIGKTIDKVQAYIVKK